MTCVPQVRSNSDVNPSNQRLNQLAGFSGLLDATPIVESTVVAKLRTAGAVILGVTTSSEWLNGRAAGAIPNGWSAVGGHVKGIFHPNQDPAGSSTGSCLAVALGLAPVALATEVCTSIISMRNKLY